MNLSLPEAKMAEMVTAAILIFVTSEGREEIIKKAIQEHLLTEAPRDQYSYGPKQTRLQAAFNDAVKVTAHKVALSIVEEQMRGEIEKIVTEAAQKVFAGELRNEMVRSIARTISTALQAKSE